MSNVFQTAEAWDASSSGSILSAGEHVVDIREVDDATSRNGNPQMVLEVGNASGHLRDWVTVTPNTLGRVVQLADAAGVDRPADGEFDPETLRLSEAWRAKLKGKKVGIVAVDEPHYSEPGKTVTKIQGYVKPELVSASSDVTPASSFTGAQVGSGPSPYAAEGATSEPLPF